MASRLEKVLIGLGVGAVVGGLAGTLAGRLPPLTLPPEQTVPGLNESNQAFGTAVGILVGEIAGGVIALAAD